MRLISQKVRASGSDLLFSSTEGEWGEEWGSGGKTKKKNQRPAEEAGQHSYITSSQKHLAVIRRAGGNVLQAGLVLFPGVHSEASRCETAHSTSFPLTSKTKFSKMVPFDSQPLHFLSVCWHLMLHLLFQVPWLFMACGVETDFILFHSFLTLNDGEELQKSSTLFSGWLSCVVLLAVYQQWSTLTRGE